MRVVNKLAASTRFDAFNITDRKPAARGPLSPKAAFLPEIDGKASPGKAWPAALTRQFAAAAAAIQIFTLPSQAMWDGESSAVGSCPLGDTGIECRKAQLAKDGLGSYSSAANNAAKIGGAAGGVPVASLDGPYATETYALGNSILTYATLDLYDPARVDLVKTLKREGQDWVSKYARGGSARTASARRFYTAVDSLLGHLASNG